MFRENKFTNFCLYTWIDYKKFKGAARYSAIILNALFGLLKFATCIVILLFLLPHLAVQSMRSNNNLPFFLKLVMVMLTILSLALDLPFFILGISFALGALQLLLIWSFPSFVASVVIGLMSYGLINIFLTLVCALFCKNDTSSKNSNSNYFVSTDKSDSTAITTTHLWKNGTECEWNSALNHYYSKVPPKMRELDNLLEKMPAEDVEKMSTQDFYNFLHDKYFVWKYTGTYLPQRQKNLQKYITEDELDELDKIKKQIFSADINNTADCLKIASKIHGLGIAGASGLLSILFPEHFGTVDKFVLLALLKIDNLSNKDALSKINPNNISLSGGVLLSNILKNKSVELNQKFDTDFWTPRKIDMVLWSIER